MVKKLHDLGRSEKEMYGSPTLVGKGKRIIYPSLSITTKQLPCLENADIGEKASLLILVEVKGVHKEKNGNRYELDVLKMGEEGETKMTKAVEKAMGQHEELDSKEESSAHEAGETASEEEAEHKGG